MKDIFVLKKMGSIEYLVINKKDVEMFCNIQRGVYETKYFRKDCLTEEEIREYFIKEKGIDFTSDELHKPSTYEYNCSKSEKIIGDLYIVKFDGRFDDEMYKVTQDFFRNAKEVILDMKRVYDIFIKYNFLDKDEDSDIEDEVI
jgi:hypothetical protein